MKTFTAYQKFVIAVLAFLQFTVILDFMILSPLGAILMPAMNITPSQFGLVVSIYAFSAGIAGLLAAGFADRFDRKKMLLFFYCGFVLGTLLCGIADTYPLLLAARMVTGLFGGVLGSVVFAITTDLFPYEMRGRVMGVIQSAFAGSQILGIPVGLFLSNHFGWHAPFFMIVGVSTLVGFVIWSKLKPIDAHLVHHVDRNAYHHLKEALTTPQYLVAFGATCFLSLGGFMLMPFSSAFTVHNLGIDIENLPMIYLITGISTMFLGPIVGRVSDHVGHFKTFLFGSVVTIVVVLIYTHLGITPLLTVILVNIILFVGIFSRMIPSQALMSAIPDAKSRGAFMSINSSIQQVAGGIAAIVAGLIVMANADSSLQHFDRLGWIMVVTISLSAYFIYRIHLAVVEEK